VKTGRVHFAGLMYQQQWKNRSFFGGPLAAALDWIYFLGIRNRTFDCLIVKPREATRISAGADTRRGGNPLDQRASRGGSLAADLTTSHVAPYGRHNHVGIFPCSPILAKVSGIAKLVKPLVVIRQGVPSVMETLAAGKQWWILILWIA